MDAALSPLRTTPQSTHVWQTCHTSHFFPPNGLLVAFEDRARNVLSVIREWPDICNMFGAYFEVAPGAYSKTGENRCEGLRIT
jgi:hypothetical protein